MKLRIPIFCFIAVHIGLFAPGIYAAPPSPEQIRQQLDKIFKFIDGIHSDGAAAPSLEPVASAPPRFVSGQVFLLNNDGSATKMALVDVCAYPSDYFSAYVNWLENDYALPARHAWGMRNIASEMVDEVCALSSKYPQEFPIDPFDLSTWRICVAAATQNLEYQLTDGWSFIAPTSIRSTTDADGRFHLKIPFAGKYHIFAMIRRGTGINQSEFVWAISSDSFALDEDLVLSNRNLCSAGRAPLKNAITLAKQDNSSPARPESTQPKPIQAPEVVDGVGVIIKYSELDEKPVVISQLRSPNYPPELRRQGISGECVVGFIITSDGGVRDIEVVSSTHEEFNKSCTEAVSTWVFRPGKKNGLKVATRMHQRFPFRITY